MKILIVNNTQI